MATAIINNLYPPIMDTYMPAFDREETCKVYFTLSSFNDIEDINAYAQIQVRYQQSNKTALKSDLYPAGIMLLPINYNKELCQYYIEFSKDSMKNNKFELNVYYKVQLRFMTPELDIPKTNQGDIIQQKYAWFNNVNNMANFSEWSKICLIRGIATPRFSFNSFDVSKNKTTTEIAVVNNRSFSDLIGKMDFTNLDLGEEEQDKLKSYEVYIYKRNDLDTILYDSKIQYPETTNSINQRIKYLFQDETYYKILIEILTVANYSETLVLDFYVSNQYRENDKINNECKIKCALDKEEGRMKIVLTDIDKIATSTFNGKLMFRRSSQESDFSYWEDIQEIDNLFLHKIVEAGETVFSFYDYTIESGNLYQYGVQKIIYNADGTERRRGLLKQSESYYTIDFEDSFLTTASQQLKIKFNPQISNFSKTVVENKVDTIGSKYPFFYRNAQVGYKTFPISGMIHSLMDENFIFLNKNDYQMDDINNLNDTESFFSHIVNETKNISKDSISNKNDDNDYLNDFNRSKIYGKYYTDIWVGNNKIIDYYKDYNYEKRFRDLVMEFLTDGKPKLFKSATEGNIIVRLMNVSFTPNQTLGRLIYNFSATAYEVDDSTLDNYIQYNLHNLNYENHYYDDYKYIDNDLKHIGEIIFNIDNASDIYEIIKQDCSFVKRVTENDKDILYNYSLNTIDWIEISFPSTEPFSELGVDESSLLYNVNNEITMDKGDSQVVYVGHVININGRDIVVPQYRSYYIKKEDLEQNNFSSIFISKEKNTSKNVKILYKASLSRHSSEQDSTKEKIKQMYLKVGAGQLWGGLESNTDVIEKILSTYKKETKNVFMNIIKVRRLYLEGTPGACFKRTRGDGVVEKYILNSTGQLELFYGEESLDNFTFCGFELYSAKNPVQMHEQEYFIPSLPTFNSIKEIIQPKNNYVYTIREQDGKINKKIYYLGHWCDFEETDLNVGLAKYKDEVIVYYLYNLQKGEISNDTE